MIENKIEECVRKIKKIQNKNETNIKNKSLTLSRFLFNIMFYSIVFFGSIYLLDYINLINNPLSNFDSPNIDKSDALIFITTPLSITIISTLFLRFIFLEDEGEPFNLLINIITLSGALIFTLLSSLVIILLFSMIVMFGVFLASLFFNVGVAETAVSNFIDLYSGNIFLVSSVVVYFCSIIYFIRMGVKLKLFNKDRFKEIEKNNKAVDKNNLEIKLLSKKIKYLLKGVEEVELAELIFQENKFKEGDEIIKEAKKDILKQHKKTLWSDLQKAMLVNRITRKQEKIVKVENI